MDGVDLLISLYEVARNICLIIVSVRPVRHIVSIIAIVCLLSIVFRMKDLLSSRKSVLWLFPDLVVFLAMLYFVVFFNLLIYYRG